MRYNSQKEKKIIKGAGEYSNQVFEIKIKRLKTVLGVLGNPAHSD